MAQWRSTLAGAALVLAAICLDAAGADKPTSGLAVGSGTPIYNVQDVTGLAKGSTICYV